MECKICTELSPLRCSFCGIVTYCGRRCQKQDWNTHRYCCKRDFTAFCINGEEFTIEVAAVHTVSDIRELIENKIYEKHENQKPTVDKVLIQKATLREWFDAKKMKDLFKVSDKANIIFTLDSPMPSLTHSSDVSSDGSSDDRSPRS